jgi:hypothetical protein
MKKKIQQNSSLSLFDWIKQIISFKKNWNDFSEEDKKTYNVFMINKFLSMNQNYLDIVNYVQKLNIQDKEKSYIVYCSMIPKSQKTYFPYIKTTKKPQDPELLDNISKYYECSNREVSEYLELLSKDEVKDILDSMGIDGSQTKKSKKNVNKI